MTALYKFMIDIDIDIRDCGQTSFCKHRYRRIFDKRTSMQMACASM